jgi:hypothetical protein
MRAHRCRSQLEGERITGEPLAASGASRPMSPKLQKVEAGRQAPLDNWQYFHCRNRTIYWPT